MVRDNLLEAIVQSPPLIRSQLCETLKAVIYNDFPHQWPGLMPQIGNNLGTTEPPRLYGALYALRILTTKYEFKDEEERQPIQEIVHVTFPHLLNIIQVRYTRCLLITPNATYTIANRTAEPQSAVIEGHVVRNAPDDVSSPAEEQ